MRGSLGPLTLLSTLLLFALPFVEFSCQGKAVTTLTGYETAFGRETKAEFDLGKWLEGREGKSRDSNREGNLTFSVRNEDTRDRDIFVAAALFCAAGGGLAAFFIRLAGVAGGAGACVLLLYAQNQMQKEMQELAPPLVVMTFQYGFWLSLAAAAAGAVLCLMSGKK